MNFRHLGDREVHQGYLWRVVVADFEDPDGQSFQRDIVRSLGAVAAVPLLFDAEGNPSVVLVEQWRPTYDRAILEIPAGMRDVAGRTGRDHGPARARRGGRPRLCPPRPAHRALPVAGDDRFGDDDLTWPPSAPPWPVTCTDRRRCTRACIHLPLADAVAMVVDGRRIADAKSVAGLLLTERRLRAGDHGAPP